ncbi:MULTISPECIES: cation:proton antiporter [Marinomonas]|uniref:Cation:proton antiporter n=1 Tax=Marinomonas arctica TaxID=383750 RepID=A0A7H1J2W3_9GAMM|nr:MULTISPECIES: cation:proton antiporter [Marinomonas]MCS7486541.1 potassium transporter [Marinomonas sp. BSi20414]QNT04829.1 cation:proton antiporter [Marinomonas arctica]GGN31135.1 potassium transporter [Marinomonas arctica]
MTDALLLTFVFLVAGVISVPIASRLGLGSVLGYLLAGIIISPLLSLFDVNIVSIQHFAELGVVLMLFLVGLELNPKKLWALRSKLFGLGGGQVVLTALLIMAAGMLLEQEWRTSLAIGLVLALSSTAIVIQTLTEKGLMKSDGGQSSFAVLLAQDIVVIPMLAFIPLLATPELIAALSHSADVTQTGNHSDSVSLVAGLEAWQTAFVTIGAIAIVILSGRFLVTPIFRFIAVAQLRELFIAAALMFVIGTTLLMSLVGLSPALGTFLAGVVLANSPYRHELESDIAPFKGLLLGLFFMTVGAGINFSLLFSHFPSILGLTLGLIMVKATTLFILGRIFSIRGSNKWLFALGLAQAGEFGFVLLSFTVSNAVISKDVADILLLVVALSMLLTPMLFILYDRVIAPRYATDQTAGTQDDMPDDNKIIIAGSGRMGSTIDNLLRLAGYHSTVIDFSVKRLRALQNFGVKNYFGDATRPDLLEAAGISEASLFIIAIDDAEQVTKLVKYIKATYPDLHIIARAFDNNHVYDLWASGCRDIIRENYDSSLRMGRSAFEALGISHHKAEQMINIFNQHDKVSMVEVADAHQIGVPAHENKIFIARLKKYLEEKNPQLQKAMQDIQQQADD